MNKKPSTFERELEKPRFRKKFEKEYNEFLLSELIISLMEDDKKSVRKLAEEIDISPTVIQKLRSGKQEDIKLSNFIKIALACGYHLILQKRGKQIPVC
jgi:DNA-binding Xre family transcriptional regulator